MSNSEEGTLEIKSPRLDGERFEAEVPDTLDLAERAKLGINALTGSFDPKMKEIYPSRYFYHKQPYMVHGLVSSMQAKFACALPMMRVMSGSDQNLGVDGEMMGLMVSWLGDDGICWDPAQDRPWNETDEDYCDPHLQGFLLRAMLVWYQYTGNPGWKSLMDKVVEGMDHMILHKEDYAYFPPWGGFVEEKDKARDTGSSRYQAGYYPRSGWASTEEPAHEKDSGEEGSVFMLQGVHPSPLALWYAMSGNKRALQLATEMVNFLTKPKMWGIEDEPRGMAGRPERAHWDGHWYGHLTTLRSLLDYAIVTNNPRLKAFVRDGYEWARNYGIAHIGWSENIAGTKPISEYQGCGPARVIALAIKLSDAGIGDYWEDVDQHIRNLGTEMQVVRADFLQKISEAGPERKTDKVKARGGREVSVGHWATTDRVIERSIGTWGMGWPTVMMKKKDDNSMAHAWTHACCTSHGNMGLYYVWEAIVRCKDGVARVNLLLNRASPWLDIDSYLPYEGKVVIRNKTAKKILARVPMWVDKEAVKSRVNGQEASAEWFGNYLIFEGLGEGDVVTIEFPMVETTTKYTVRDDKEYTCHFKGNTLVDISPRDEELGYPLFLRDHLKQDKAPMKKVARYVSPVTIEW